MQTHILRLDYVPLSAIEYNPAINARRDTETDISELAATLDAQDIGQPLLLRPAGGHFEPVDGGRRLRALKRLAYNERIPHDHPVPALIRELSDTEALSLSLATAITRQDLDPADEALSFTDLAMKGMAPEEIAARFGLPLRRVKQRLAIGRLPAEIIAALKAREIDLKDAQAYTLLNDPAHAAKLFEAGVRSHWAIVQSFEKARVPETSAVARHVGREAYVAAGGQIDEDLFSNNAWFADGKLLNKLFQQKLKDDEKTWLAEGWSFVIIELDGYKTLTWPLLAPEGKRVLTPEQKTLLASLKAEKKRVDAELHKDVLEGDAAAALEDRLADIEKDILDLCAKPFTDEQKKKSGVVVSNRGRIEVRFGVMKPGVAKKEARQSKQTRDDDGEPSAVRRIEPEAEADFTQSLAVEMAKVMTHAMQAAIIDKPSHSLQLATALLMLLGSFHRADGFIVDAPQRRNAELGERAAAVQNGSVGQILESAEADIAKIFAATGDHPQLDDLIARSIAPLFQCYASNIDALRPLINAFDPDVAAIWTPDESFFKRMPRESLAAALGEAAIAGVTPSKKKKELVEMALRELVPLGWLPKPLRTPSYKGPGSNAWSDAHAAKTADEIAEAPAAAVDGIEEDAA